jgi:serine/threonine protein kinase
MVDPTPAQPSSKALALARAGEVFNQIDLDASPAQQHAQARSLCASLSPDVAILVAQIIENYNDQGSSLDSDSSTNVMRAEVPQSVGPYRVVGKLGAGGFGVVLKAVDSRQPVSPDGSPRFVALKLLAPMASDGMRKRFDDEVRAIKRQRSSRFAPTFHEFGSDGLLPYIVMEYIDGEPFLDHAKGLPLAQQLKLFVELCVGTQEMHTRMMIHRDLKSSNVLVDRSGTPRILDYGIARLLSLDDEPGIRHTLTHEKPGTLEWMSPEQLDGSGDVDARADVYALGVMLFAMLTSEMPRNQRGADGRQLTTEQFSKLHARRLRSCDPHMPKDLDAICAKAMFIDRVHRYSTAGALAEDIERYLSHNPVLAMPPSRWYFVSRFVRRHRIGVIATTSAAILLLTSSAYARHQTGIARRNERIANETSEIWNNILYQAAESSDGSTVTVRRALERAIENPIVKPNATRESLGNFHYVVANALMQIGDGPAGEPHAKLAYDHYAASLGPRSEQTVNAQWLESLLGFVNGKKNLDSMIAIVEASRDVDGLEPLLLAERITTVGSIAVDYGRQDITTSMLKHIDELLPQVKEDQRYQLECEQSILRAGLADDPVVVMQHWKEAERLSELAVGATNHQTFQIRMQAAFCQVYKLNDDAGGYAAYQSILADATAAYAEPNRLIGDAAKEMAGCAIVLKQLDDAERLLAIAIRNYEPLGRMCDSIRVNDLYNGLYHLCMSMEKPERAEHYRRLSDELKARCEGRWIRK